VFLLGKPEVVIPITAIFCFVGGLLRIVYALLMEDSLPPLELSTTAPYSPPATPQLDTPARNFALPPPAAQVSTDWRQRPRTSAEIYQPPSVTENTTRLLDKDDPKAR
jgi:hypothetical protein